MHRCARPEGQHALLKDLGSLLVRIVHRQISNFHRPGTQGEVLVGLVEVIRFHLEPTVPPAFVVHLQPVGDGCGDGVRRVNGN